ncbi:MAG: NAD(P)/FAD-dependent oxidoreductase [Clostridia bacterium]|nr:NAD(P)/FAD-dependent oxidoreductase [Clostridia bacterium]
MEYRLDNIRLNPDESESKLHDMAVKKLGHEPAYFRILKKSLDARDKKNIFWLYSIVFSDEVPPEPAPLKKLENPPKVAIIGSGPAGLLCAIQLIARGVKPVIIERGKAVEERKDSVQKFIDSGILDDNCNVQFGEGGAGAFSDGKLNTGTKDPNNAKVLETFVHFGAPREILYSNKPHVGSDVLYTVLKNMRKYIICNGGKYMFSTRLMGIKVKEGRLQSIQVLDVMTGLQSDLRFDAVVLAIGHSARDTFEILHRKGVYMEPRPFAVGVRIEHVQEDISRAQYGPMAKYLPAADYKAVSHASERSVFTFCMCPGGVVLPSSSEFGGVVTNGMSNYARDGRNANSALMVQMGLKDFGEGLFAGMDFQRRIERKAYAVGGRNYKAPVQRVGDFLAGKCSDHFGSVKPTYACGTVFAPMEEVLPGSVTDALRLAIPDIDKHIKGFADPDALLTGVESRFSSPIRMVRNENGESVSVAGLYPCGEGSGYSGGITSSAADGIGCAEKIFAKYEKF